jgi:transposase
MPPGAAKKEKPSGADKMTPEKGQPTLAESLLRRRQRECAVLSLSAKLSNLQIPAVPPAAVIVAPVIAVHVKPTPVAVPPAAAFVAPVIAVPVKPAPVAELPAAESAAGRRPQAYGKHSNALRAKAIRMVRKKEKSIGAVAAELKISRSTLKGWLARDDHYLELAEQQPDACRERDFEKYAPDFDQFKANMAEAADAGEGLTNEEMKVMLAAESDVWRKASDGKQLLKLNQFRRKLGLSLRKVTGTSQIVPENRDKIRIAFGRQLEKLLEAEEPDVIVVADETFLNWFPARGKVHARRGTRDVTVRPRRRQLRPLWRSSRLQRSRPYTCPSRLFIGRHPRASR